MVWDFPTRLFHWSLVGGVAVALATGLIAPEWWKGVHAAAGYVVVLLLVFRLVWGLFGSEYSRVASFIYSPRKTLEHVRGLMLLRPPHYIGHNPSGAAMIFALLAVLTGLAATGLIEWGGEEKQGPLAGVVDYALGNGVKPVHKMLAFTLIAMVALHVCGVLVEGVVSRAPLIRSMITGWKSIPAEFPTPEPRSARPIAAVLMLAAIAIPAGIVLGLLSRLPAIGLPVLPANAQFATECGACHRPFHPSLLPRASWAALMSSLPNHFGEDASLPADEARQIGAYLQAYASEAWDTEAARRFATVAPEQPLRITETPYWRTKHSRIDPSVFARAAVGAKSNCTACHGDAASGRFDDQAINIPGGGGS
jgi:cytochrome b